MATKSLSLKSPVEVLPSLLLWGPELTGGDIDSIDTYVDALELCACDGQINGYYVHHYQEVPGAWGQAYGPFALDQTLRFCRRLKGQLASFRCGGGRLCLTATVDIEAHTNAAVLLGAYLILVEDWSAKAVADVLGSKESQRKIPCAWAKPHIKEKSWSMRVIHCWEGLAMAHLQGWVDTKCLIDDDLTESYCEEYRSMVATYDAAWMMPGKLLVSADPVTTAYDPNPETFSQIFASEDGSIEEDDKAESGNALPQGDVVAFSTGGREGQVSPISTASTEPEPVQYVQGTPMSADAINRRSLHDLLSPTSVATVCKDYVETGQRRLFRSTTSESKAYSSFLQDCNVSLVIRANFADEPGMPRPSYNAKEWDRYNVRHKNIQFEDKAGGLPLTSSVADLLAVDAELAKERPGAILIHCKGGFGRSVLLCCCLMIYHHDVSGSALLGWSRIVRPGAITTTQQEAFLLSMKGRADILKFVGGKARVSQTGGGEGANVTCGCIVQ